MCPVPSHFFPLRAGSCAGLPWGIARCCPVLLVVEPPTPHWIQTLSIFTPLSSGRTSECRFALPGVSVEPSLRFAITTKKFSTHISTCSCSRSLSHHGGPHLAADGTPRRKRNYDRYVLANPEIVRDNRILAKVKPLGFTMAIFAIRTSRRSGKWRGTINPTSTRSRQAGHPGYPQQLLV